MKIFYFLLINFILLFFTNGNLEAQGKQAVLQRNSVPAGFCINSSEMELYRRINEYRKKHSLPPIPLSKSLSYVAAMHAKDLFLHHPDQGPCNSHSWSNKGSWTPFCYPRDENKKNSVWDKPRELTKYPSKAYEIVYWENNSLLTDTIMMVWTTEEYFNNFLLNSGKWQGNSWKAIGIAVYENYACAWFGEQTDPEGDVYVCGMKPVTPLQDTVKPVGKPGEKPPVKPKKPKTAKPAINKGDSSVVKKTDSLIGRPADTTSIIHRAEVPKDSITLTYYIIVNSMLTKAKANELIITLKSKGFPDSKIIEKNGKNNVSVFESPDYATSKAKLKELRQIYKDAWLLKK